MAEYINKAKLYNTIAKLEEKARKHYLENLESSVLSGNAERAFARLSERTAFKHLVADFRASDVAPVVRCKDCKFCDDAYCYDGRKLEDFYHCNWLDEVVGKDDFCSHGEKEE